jgi:hypothetical protein
MSLGSFFLLMLVWLGVACVVAWLFTRIMGND